MLINKKNHSYTTSSRGRMIGASMIEYLLGLIILVTALTVVPLPNSNGLSAVELFELALKNEYASYSESIANPR